MNILLTNDDGHDAAGLIALFNAARAIGRPVVVAPARPHSMKSHSLTTTKPIRIERKGHPLFGECYVCDATPADCVRLALRHLPIPVPDVVVAGINHGANAGVEVFYSGTVAAAREGVLLGRMGVAISQLMKPGWSDNWSLTTELAIKALNCGMGFLGSSREPGLLNVNLPDVGQSRQLQGVRYCQLTPDPLAVEFSASPVEANREYETGYTGRYFDRAAPPGSDFHALMNDWITITPLLVDLTDHVRLAQHLSGA